MNVEKMLESIVPKVKEGDMEAFSTLYDLTYKYVFKIAYSITLSKEDAEDVVQNTYLKIFEKRKTLDHGEAIMGYLKRIAINYALKISQKKQPKFIEMEAKMHEDSTSEIVKEALEKLNPKDRSVLSLFYIDNLSIKEISFILEESEESIRTRLSRARNKLREVIEHGEV